MLYPYVYQQKEDAGSEDNGWASLIISLADGKTDDKSLETVMNSNLYNVLIGLNKKSKEYHEYMSKIEAMTDINSYVEYFRTLATEHKEINDF